MEDRQWFILYVVVCLEVGLFLTVVPWSAIWERNYFLEAYPLLRPILLAPVTRGAVAGLGVANVYMGLREVMSRRRARPLVRSDPSDLQDPLAFRRDSGSSGTAGRREEALAATDDRP